MFSLLLITLNTKVPLILHTKFKLNILRILEKNDFIGFAIFLCRWPSWILDEAEFTILKHWSLIMLHLKSEIHGCSGLRE